MIISRSTETYGASEALKGFYITGAAHSWPYQDPSDAAPTLIGGIFFIGCQSQSNLLNGRFLFNSQNDVSHSMRFVSVIAISGMTHKKTAKIR